MYNNRCTASSIKSSAMTVIAGETQLDMRTPIQQFYSGQNVFITGGTGFLGKILIEKLLRSCSDLSSIYILIRPKKGQNVHQRVENIFDDPIFERLKKEVPKFRHKIVAVAGDCGSPGLGLSEPDRELLLRDISVVFNVAATVRFDEKLRQAVAINIGGTKEVLELCRRMHNLRAVVHVSTAYSNCNRKEIDEKFYDTPISGDNIIQLVQSVDDGKLDAITEILLGDFPNTYAYTKCIAEQVIQQHGKDLPIGIFRPAIVISSYREPVEGWVDNVYGPTGAVVGCGAGLIRTMNIDENCTAELVPVDLTVNALIATAWDIANNKNEAADPPIYNYHASWNKSFTWGKYINLGFKYGKKTPSIRSIWCYSMVATKSYYLFYVLSLLLHILPAFIIDVGLFVVGQKPRALKIYKKIHKFSTVTTYFSTNKWEFGFANTKSLWDNLSSEDQKLFLFSMTDFDWEDYMQKCILGLRLHVFKDDPSTIPRARKRMAKILMLHKFIKIASIAFVAWILYELYTFVASIGSMSFFASVSENIIDR